MQHNFIGPCCTVGIEEELMIVDEATLDLVNAIDALLGEVPEGEVKPELMESVLEISTAPAPSITDAGRQLRALRGRVVDTARQHGLRIGAAGTHPFALWEDQRIVGRARYRDLLEALGFVARQELIFGMHVHVGIDDPDKAIHVANGMRVHLPVLLGLSANSPFWRADATGLASSRAAIFRAFPRVGIPPAHRDWAAYERDVEFMVAAGLIDDYTYLWYDVRPHPRLGTVEIRVFDTQTDVEHAIGLAALVQALVRELCEGFAAGDRAVEQAGSLQLLDENKWLAARHGLDGELVDLPSSDRVATRVLARRLVDRAREHAADLGAAAELAAVEDLIGHGTGSQSQVDVHRANSDLHEVMADIVARTQRV